MAICVMAVCGMTPCQCFSSAAQQITSPGRMILIGPPQLCTRPHPDVTISVWPSGCVCQLLRAHGSNVTVAPRARAGSGALKSGSTRTVPVKYSAGPLAEGCDPLRLMSIVRLPLICGCPIRVLAYDVTPMQRVCAAQLDGRIGIAI